MTAARTAGRMRVRIVQLDHAQGLPLPKYESKGAAGLDLLAAIDTQSPVTLAPGARALVPTGLALEIPSGYEGQVRPRSGLALNYGITVLNSPGTIDSDYRGEVGVVLANLGHAPFEIRRGDRIAQLIFAPVAHANLVAAKSISTTSRGAGGFGSTGTSASGRSKRASTTSKKKKSVPAKTATAKKGTRSGTSRKK